MTMKRASKCSVSIEETLLNLNRFQLTTFQGNDIFQCDKFSLTFIPLSVFCSPTEKISVILSHRLATWVLVVIPVTFMMTQQKTRIICNPIVCSMGFWQSFVTIGSCNHLIRIISTYIGNTKKSEISWRCQTQLWDVKRTLSYFLVVANSKTIHSLTSRIVISFR